MKPAYLNLCTEFYDLTKPEAGPKEVNFYENFLHTAQGPILEAMCGSGRLLIPLLKKGFKIEGVDNSKHMIQSCKERCKEQCLNVQLYNQSLQQLLLPKKYSIIFIAIGSFQLIYEHQEALKSLENLHSALLPGGKLLIETFVPWEVFKENILDSKLSDQSEERFFEKTVTCPDQSKITHKSLITVNFKEQVERTKSHYEKWVNDTFSHAEEEEYIVRWYHRFEMELLLQKAGFSSVNIIDASFKDNEQVVIYEAIK